MDDPSDESQDSLIRHIPTLQYFQKMYGISCEGNDQKAIQTFASYEPLEKVRRLQQELQWVKGGRVSTQVCDHILGRKRKNKFQGYDRWAELVLLWLASAKKG